MTTQRGGKDMDTLKLTCDSCQGCEVEEDDDVIPWDPAWNDIVEYDGNLCPICRYWVNSTPSSIWRTENRDKTEEELDRLRDEEEELERLRDIVTL